MFNKSMIIAFIFGVGIGSAVTWKVVKDYYAKLADEEIKSVKKSRSINDVKKVFDEVEKEETVENKAVINSKLSYEEMLVEHKYKPYSSVKEEIDELVKKVRKEEEPENQERIAYISPMEFAELEEYDSEELKYYDDGVLTDELDEIIDDVADYVGIGFKNHFGEYEEDSVFVRNHGHRCDYQVIRSYMKYSDVVKTKPHPVEVE